MDHNLEKDRDQIDLLDQEILKLLNDRAKLSVNIARIKSQKKMPVFIPDRENNLLDRIVAKNMGPLDAEAIRKIFISIMDESKRLQHTILEETTKLTPEDEE